MKLRLSHPSVGEVAFPLAEGGQAVLGRRGGDTSIELNWDPKISRRHARVWIEDGALWIEDLGSRNGTWHQGTRLAAPFRLDAGTKVRVGETALEHADIPVADLMSSVATGTLPGIHRDQLFKELKTAVEALPSASSVDVPEPPPKPKGPSTRFLPNGEVGVEVETREAFEALWFGDLAKAGLFVPSDTPPAFGTRLVIRIKTPGGVLKVAGRVVHVVDRAMAAQFSMAQGVGLQIEHDGDHEAVVHAYLAGDSERLGSTAARQNSGVDVSAVMLLAKRLIAYVERDELYKGLDLPPDALQSEVDARLRELDAHFSEAEAELAPPQAARMKPARRSLAHIAQVLGVTEARLEHDFNAGRIDAEKRIQAAADRSGPALSTLRAVWRSAYPNDVEQAQRLLHTAFEMRRLRNFDQALSNGREALSHDPFWLELRRTVETWESLYTPEASIAS